MIKPLILFAALSCTCAFGATLPNYTCTNKYDYIPSYHHTLVCRKGIFLSYNQEYKIPDWAISVITPITSNTCSVSRGSFYADPDISTAKPTDYTNSGYDRGHLSPNDDNTWSYEAERNSFSMANIAPQRPSFNRGPWKQIETYLRKISISNNYTFEIITGTIIPQTPVRLGNSGPAIPTHFWKIAYNLTTSETIAFLGNQDSSDLNVASYIVPIDQIEQLIHQKLPHLKTQRQQLWPADFRTVKPFCTAQEK